jgi:hypothetical protein
LGRRSQGAAFFHGQRNRSKTVLSKSPNTVSPKMTFAFSGDSTVRLARNVPCPHCGRFFHASDAEVTFGSVTLICAGCHVDVLVITGRA